MELDPETQVVATMGAKEGLVHLMWTLVEPGDAALVPAPSYPIHIHAPILAGASVFQVAMAPDQDLVREPRGRVRARLAAAARAAPLLPAQPDDRDRRARRSWSASSSSPASARSLVVHDFAYADLAFDGHEPPSILQVPRRDATSPSSSTR